MRKTRRVRLRATVAAVGAFGLVLLGAPYALASGAPTSPTELFNGYAVCSDDASAPTYVEETGLAPIEPQGVDVEGVPGDTDPGGTTDLAEQFRVWPVSDPAQTSDFTSADARVGWESQVRVPSSMLADGQTYAWQAQTVAGTAASDWSAPCYFTVDDTHPSAAPVISSANYPEGERDQPGEPAQFIFGANGMDDVAGFEFAWGSENDLPVIVYGIGSYGIPQPAHPYDYRQNFVRADALGGSATVSLIPPPPVLGTMTLYVRSIDRALNVSPAAAYSFSVAAATPTITPIGQPQFDQPATFELDPDAQLQAQSPTVSYTVQTAGGQHDQSVQVQAAADGTAQAELTLDGTYGELLTVTSTSANGWVSDDAQWNTDFDTTTTITSDVYPENASGGGVGIPGTFTFAPKMKNIASYTYFFTSGGSPTTVEAGDDNQPASITWTPTDSGDNSLLVYATTKDGIQLANSWYSFTVN
jgi:hypothetical protein